MSQASWDIEQIVEEVLAALRGQEPTGPSAAQSEQSAAVRSAPASGSPPSGVPPAGCPQTKAPAASSGSATDGQPKPTAGHVSDQEHPPKAPRRQPSTEDGQLRIASRLVTMAELRACGAPENLTGVRRVVVRPDALVTPMVRDELQRRNIPLTPELRLAEGEVGSAGTVTSAMVRRSASGGQPADGKPSPSGLGESTNPAGADAIVPAGAPGAGYRLLLVIHGTAYEPAGLVRRLTSERTPVEVRRMDCILRATEQLAEAVRTGNCLGVLLTQYAAIGVCAANRQPGVRAVWGLEAGQSASDTASLGANLLVINPRHTPPYQLHKMIQDFYQAGVRPCPEGLKSRLG